MTAETGTSGDATDQSFPIVGIGASAGGLAAFQQLLHAIPDDTDMAYGLVQHLDPSHDSSLASILTRTSGIPVVQATDGMLVERNHAYVIPPGVCMTLRDGHLALEHRGNVRVPHSVDAFFESLALVLGSQAVGVVLSGTGSDGACGTEAIKEAGGITFAQDPVSASYDGMPRAAMATGAVDFVLPPVEIATHLARMARLPLAAPRAAAAAETEASRQRREPTAASGAASDIVGQVLGAINLRTGVDFRGYKRGTMERRLLRRMLSRRIERPADYVELLRREPEEVTALTRDLLINVTRFFRDADAFATLSTNAFPRLLHDRPANAPIRVWVPGCASGEEVYSIAMVLLEYLGDAERRASRHINSIQIFGTDLSAPAIAVARRGIYPRAIEQDVSPERLERFFVRDENGYRVSPALRAPCTFAVQNMVKDPPFARLDLISCRNVLIYFQPALQAKALDIFHFALKSGGMMFLGSSESIGISQKPFSTLDKRHRLYVRAPGAGQPLHVDHLTFDGGSPSADRVPAHDDAARPAQLDGMSSPNGANARKPGKQPSVSSSKSSRKASGRSAAAAAKATRKPRETVATLRTQLAAAKNEAQNLGEEHTSAMEELRATNEEIQSSNEELQSTAEELETTKEELQSVNEELTTVNDELRDRNTELVRLNDDLVNVSSSIQTPVVIVTLDQRIRQYTAGAERLLNLIATDVGRPIGDLRSNIDGVDLSRMISEAIDTLTTSEREVRDRAGRWYSMTVRPYKTSEQRIEGAVLVFHDIDARKEESLRLEEARRDAVAARAAADSARGEADAANRAKGHFLAAMSHELRTPLTAISGYTELLKLGVRGPLTETQHADLAGIKRSADHLLSLIGDVLNFAKIEKGQMEIESADVPIQSVLEDLGTFFAPQLAARGLRFVVGPCDNTIVVRGDRERVLQILLNLVSNATKFTPRGGTIVISCDARHGADNSSPIHLRVRDSGIGIASEKLEAVFAPFVQEGRQLNAPREGVGLGLAIGRELARAMGGDLTVESVVGVGSTFSLTLPRASISDPQGA